MFMKAIRTMFYVGILFFSFARSVISQEITQVRGSFGSNEISSISADGRYVSFATNNKNVVSGDTNSLTDIFVYDRLSKQPARISVSSNGIQTNGESYGHSLSADGQYVVFESDADNLVTNDTNGVRDIFIHDRATKQTTRVSISTNGVEGNSASSQPKVSADGRYVAFVSTASNLVVGDNNGFADAFVHDRLTKQTTRVSVASDGSEANGSGEFGIESISLSANGQFVAFASYANNLVVGDSNNKSDIFIHNRITAKTTLVSVANDGAQANSNSYRPSLSADGRYVAFTSTSNNLIANDKVGEAGFDWFIFVHDRKTNKATRINIQNIDLSLKKIHHHDNASISADGRYVALQYGQWPPETEVSDIRLHVFLYDRWTHQTTSEIISPGRLQYAPSLNADGRFMSFHDDYYFLENTERKANIYVLDRILNTTRHADLKIGSKQVTWRLKANEYGLFHFVITNHGGDSVNNVNLTHVLSNGPKLLGLIPSQGVCNRYAAISLCQLGRLLPSSQIDLFAVAKAGETNPLIQRMTVNAQPVDPAPGNNRLYVSTQVTP